MALLITILRYILAIAGSACIATGVVNKIKKGGKQCK